MPGSTTPTSHRSPETVALSRIRQILDSAPLVSKCHNALLSSILIRLLSPIPPLSLDTHGYYLTFAWAFEQGSHTLLSKDSHTVRLRKLDLHIYTLLSRSKDSKMFSPG